MEIHAKPRTPGMDVKCERCSTEYEFDDALVSGRGTTVKCTNCGHKFKIRRQDGDFSEDFWNVATADGRTLVFTSLRELQRAIQANIVDRLDRISRGGLPPKGIGQIPELASFFDQRGKAGPPPVSRAPSASSEVDKQVSRPPQPAGAVANLLPPPRARTETRPDYPPQDIAPSKTFVGTPPDPGVDSVAPPSTEREPEPDTQRLVETAKKEEKPAPISPPPPAAVQAAPAATETVRISAPPPLPARARKTPRPPPPDISSPLPPLPTRKSYPTDPSEEISDSLRVRASFSDAPSSMGRRRGVGGYVVSAVVILGLGVLAVFWAKDNLRAALNPTKAPAVAPTIDPRASTYLEAGEKALADGNLDLAKESYDKASALAEKNPRVLLGLARLAAVRADVVWLRLRLLPESATDEQRIAKESLAELGANAKKAAEDTFAVSPEDPAALRAKIDALRISGDRDGARALVARIGSNTNQPESAYVLAALDLADAEPLWSTVIERLRTASSSETGPGRARAALVYALARSGDGVGAKSEVDRLGALPRTHPLLPLLRQFAELATPRIDAGATDPRYDAGATLAAGGKKGGAPAGAPGGDSRSLVAQGDTARHKGDYERARQMYAAALDKNPSDSEALYGLAAIAHAQRDLAGAKASYKRVLSINPNYLPALIGSADVDWESGDKASAVKAYKEIVDRYPESAYPMKVRQRSEGGGG